MPPKAPKISQEEAKRLEEEKRRQQEEQARLQQQRKRYLAQKLEDSQLILPASAFLIIDFATKPLQFISEKLKECFKQFMPHLLEIKAEHTLNFILKELHYYIKDSIMLFGKTNDINKLKKHRIFIGIMTAVLVNGLTSQNEKLSKKQKKQDQKLIKQLLGKQTKCKFAISNSDVVKILNYSSQKYFCRYHLITMFDQFKKSKKQTTIRVHIQIPNISRNSKETVWIDLSQNPKQNNVQPVQDK